MDFGLPGFGAVCWMCLWCLFGRWLACIGVGVVFGISEFCVWYFAVS